MAGDAGTTRKPLLCRVGIHAYVRRRPDEERLRGPDHQVCRRCGKQRQRATTVVPPGFLS